MKQFVQAGTPALPLVLLVLAGAVVFYCFISRFAVNVPLVDDYGLFHFLYQAYRPDGSTGKTLFYLFQVNNDHRWVLPRLLTWADYLLEKQVNIRHLIFFGNLFTIGFLGYMAWVYRQTGRVWWGFVPIVGLVISPFSQEMYLMLLNTLQHFPLVFLVCTAGLLAARPGQGAFWGSLLCCFAGLYTNANGLLLFVAVLVIWGLAARWRRFGLGLVALLAGTAMYFYGFEFGQGADAQSGLASPLRAVAYGLAFLGSTQLAWGQGVELAAAFGGVVLGVGLWFMWPYLQGFIGVFQGKKPLPLPPHEAILIALFVFLCGSAAIIALFRSGGELNFPQRFHYYGTVAASVAYLMALQRFRMPVGAVAALLPVTALYEMAAVHTYARDAAFRHDQLLADAHNLCRQYPPFTVDKSFFRNAQFFWQPTLRQGRYAYPSVPDARPDAQVLPPAANARISLSPGDRDLMTLHISGVEVNKPDVNTRYFLLLTPESRPAARPLWLATRTRPATFSRYLSTLNPYGNDGLDAHFPSANLPAGTYRLQLLRRTGEGDEVGEIGRVNYQMSFLLK